MKFRCFVIDDNRVNMDLLVNYVNKIEELELAGSSTNPIQAKQEIIDQALHVDIVFMDIQMPGISGLELALLLQDYTEIIFSTGYKKYAAEAYQINAVDYLMKPISFERFKEATQRAKDRIATKGGFYINDNLPYIFLPGNGKSNLVKVYLESIQYIKANSNYMEIHTSDKTLLCYITITQLLKLLPASNFMQIQKSYIVNLDSVKRIDAKHVYFENEDEVPIGDHYKDALFKKVKRY